MTELCRWLLLSVLVLIAAAKVLHPAGQEALVSGWMALPVAFLEVSIAVMLVQEQLVRPACRLVQLLAMLGIVVALVSRKSCGCIGGWVQLGHAEHMVVASLLGLLATLCHFAWSRRQIRMHQLPSAVES